MIDTVIFDLGGVLIDWNPRYLYRKLFKSEEEVTWFLTHVCTQDWNEEQDAGRTMVQATQVLLKKFPQHELPILAWNDRWDEMFRGSLAESVELLRAVRKSNHGLYALTNWSAEKFPAARKRFEFLSWFDGIVVSGEEKTRKPFPEIFNILLKRYTINPSSAFFTDDNEQNVKTALSLGIDAVQFIDANGLRSELTQRGILSS